MVLAPSTYACPSTCVSGDRSVAADDERNRPLVSQIVPFQPISTADIIVEHICRRHAGRHADRHFGTHVHLKKTLVLHSQLAREHQINAT